MDEHDTESERWRLSRYAPPQPTTDDWQLECAKALNQLAAEREKWQGAMKEWQYSLKVKQDQLAAVKALVEGNKTGCGTCHTILAALAKI